MGWTLEVFWVELTMERKLLLLKQDFYNSLLMNRFSSSIILSFLLALFTLSACTFETDSSGELGQYWHLTDVDTLATNGSCDVSARRVFWAFQGKIMQAYDCNNQKVYNIHYEHKGNTLKLTEPRKNDRENGDPLVEDASALRPLGINALEETYRIEQLDGGRMVLADTINRLHFLAQ